MKKAIFEKYGDLDTIKIEEAEMPKISNKEVLVKVISAGLNPKDVLIRKGKFKRLSGKSFRKPSDTNFRASLKSPIIAIFKKEIKYLG